MSQGQTLDYLKNAKVAFIGGGNMAKAISEAMVRKNLTTYSNIIVSGPHLENLTLWKERGATVTTSNAEAVNEGQIIIIAVKPHILSKAVSEFFTEKLTCPVCGNKIFISVVAGVSLDDLYSLLEPFPNSAKVEIFRVMPNTPMSVGEGFSFVTAHRQKVRAESMDVVKALLEAGGACEEVPEAQLNNGGALTACGPAFVYLFLEALSDGAVRMGVPRDLATKCAAQTILGAAKMVLETGRHPGQLKDEVCSPGGTTIAGIHALEVGGVRGVVMNALEASTKRASELGEIAKKTKS